jgi:peptidoglycan hydrolase-like amidase
MPLRIMLAVALLVAPATLHDASPAQAGASCTQASFREPPATIRVFRMHRRGSKVRSRVDTVWFKTYVARVMASGAWPAYKPMESLKVGAIAIKQYAWYLILHHQRGYSLRGQCYDIRDGDQLYRPPFQVHSRILKAVNATWDVRLIKNDRFIRTGWSGSGGRCAQFTDGWHLPEDGISACAREGWSWRRIVRKYMAPVEIVG